MADKVDINSKINKLREGMAWFDSDDFKLEEASERYKNLASLAKEVEQDLNDLKNEIEVVAEDFTK